MPTKEDLKYFQSMPLDIKVAMTRTRIREWVNYFGESGVYVSFSGGKDSTVLLHLVRELYPDVPAVFVDTGLEYPEIRAFVKSFDNVTILKPQMRFDKVIQTYGYPVISKEVCHKVYGARRGAPWAIKAVNGLLMKPNGEKSPFNIEKYKPLVYTDFKVASVCCDIMKKNPSHRYGKETDRKPITATMASESMLREQKWIQNGCNGFNLKLPISNPMSFWTENDVLQYIHENNIPIASVYGDIIKDEGQMSLFESNEGCKFRTSGCDRTGCIFCGFGAHMEQESRFKRLKETHPKQYNYCIGGENMTLTGCGSLTSAA
jgi:3'-phosphoadenosine 5'-phosphosulfate sulfotransferase (PAPS reductase)/FAD synthetase